MFFAKKSKSINFIDKGLNKDMCLPEYLHACFLMHHEVLQQLGVSSKGAVMPGLNMQIIKNLKIPLAPIDLQNDFAKISLKIKKQTRCYEADLYKLDALFASLQQRAFRGEL